MKGNRYIVGVDVGGTFTDIFVFDQHERRVHTTKIPSSHIDQSRAFVEGISRLVDSFADIATVIHGTTVGTNALLERKGAATGLITTRGFRDVLEMRRRDRPTTWGLWGQFTPIIDRNRRLEVDERVLADGTLRVAVDTAQVKEQAQALLHSGCEAVCVFFINAYANSANEVAAANAVREVWPNEYVTAAADIVPEIREFERASTAALNAYLQPVVSSYLERLQTALNARGFQGEILIVQSNGGVMTVDSAKQFPVRTALSGPAAGVMAGRAIAQAAGFSNVITCDMGGTSFDVALIADGESALAAQTSIDFGLVVRTPMIEISTIGAGGGSIAHVDQGGILQVGPQSAGSEPGPVCYALGNDQPTVTDANVVLGRINAERPIGGKLKRLDTDAARQAIDVHIARPLGLTIEAAAEAILSIANAKMAGAIRLVSIERGHDPAQFIAMPFGGGGALHTGAFMKEVGLDAAVVPRFPGVTSALGCVVADMRHDRVHTINRLLGDADAKALGDKMKQDGDHIAALLAHAGVEFESVDREYGLDMLYVGQTHTIHVPLDMPTAALSDDHIREAFEHAYRASFGRLLPGIAIRIMNYRIAVVGRRPAFDMGIFHPSKGHEAQDCIVERRPVWINGATEVIAIYDRLRLRAGTRIEGPAILEQPDTTIFVDADLYGEIDAIGNFVMRREAD